MRHAPSIPETGQIARLRQRTYLVDDVIPPTRAADATRVRLSCVDDDNQGAPLEVLWEKELDPQLLTAEAWEQIAAKGFDPAPLFAAYLNTLRWNCVTATDPKLFQAPFRAGIRIDAYQLEPLRKALLLPRVNLFIADDVGLGKTIEAGLIARELLLRKKVKEIVVCCPPSMLLQWKEELEARFGLTFEILDKDYVRRIRRDRGFGINPWTTHTRFLVSQRLLIDEAYAAPLRDHLGTFRGGSLLILDEAHHAAPASGQRYAIDSQITRAVRDLAPRFEHRLFLSATPHNGHSNSFSALLEILDPQRFCRGVPVTPEHRDQTVIRRIKEDIREIQGGFPRREVVQIDIDGLPEGDPQLQLSRLLEQYRTIREQRLETASKRSQATSGLLITGLQQRLLSSIEAFARTLNVHRRTVEKQWLAAASGGEATARPGQASDSLDPRSLDLLGGGLDQDDDRAQLEVEQLAAVEEAQVEAASAATLGPTAGGEETAMFARERELLEQMAALAEQARGENDARVDRLVAWIRQHMCPELGRPGARWNNLRVLIFTEFDDTKRWLVNRLEAAIEGSDRAESRIEVFHGPTPVAKREQIKHAFNAHPSHHPLRILVATDAAREGLNLQAQCCHLFHFDVPWNPSRMEQRNGRIDRKLQPSDTVWCHYFVYRQRPEDRILQVLVKKTERIRHELGSLSQVLDARLAKSLSGGIRHSAIDSLASELDRVDLQRDHRQAIEHDLEAARDRQQMLRHQIDQLRHQIQHSRQRIGLTLDHFQAAINSGLSLLQMDDLRASDTLTAPSGEQVVSFTFPPIDQKAGGDPTWAETMDTLRAPRSRDQKLWDWRRSSPIRPIVFDDPGMIGQECVHLHLEQRVVQRLLGRFVAQGFVHHDLSRACFAQSDDAVPRVILLGRLCLYGDGAARLHEQLVPVTATWRELDLRRQPLEPLGDVAEEKTLELLDRSLIAAARVRLPTPVVERLQAAAATDIQQLLPHLERRCEASAEQAQRQLSGRGQAEAAAMREILQTQQKHIAETIKRIAKLDRRQLRLDYGDDEDELAQVEANQRYWAKRLEEIKGELKSEPERIEALYGVRARRIEPVGLVYLWPVTG